MYTPTSRAQPSGARHLAAEIEKGNRRSEKGKNRTHGDGRTTPPNNAGEVTRTVVENTVTEVSVLELAPPIASLHGEAAEAGQSEPEIWQRFQELGALDVDSLEKKDRAALLGRISTLEAELYDYQYNMGLLLMERKTWTAQSEDLNAAILEAEGRTQREQSAHLIALEEARRREDVLRRSLDVEQQCVADLEKALNEMRAEASESRLSADTQVSRARELMASVEEKLLKADGKLFEAQAVHAEASRKHADSERKVKEAEAREDALRRERQALITGIEARKQDLDKEQDNLKAMEGSLQEGRKRVHEGERLLNAREQAAGQREANLRRLEREIEESKLSLAKEVEDSKRSLEKDRSQLHQSETDLGARITAVMEREETAVAMEVAVGSKEKALLLAQETLRDREKILEERAQHLKNIEDSAEEERKRLEIHESTLKLMENSLVEQRAELVKLQMIVDEQKMELKSQNEDIEIARKQLGDARSSFVAEQRAFEVRTTLAAEKMVEVRRAQEMVAQRELEADQISQQLGNREQNLEVKSRRIEEKERILRLEEGALETERRKLHQEKETLKVSKKEIEDTKATFGEEQQQLRFLKENFYKEHEIEIRKLSDQTEMLRQEEERARAQLKDEKDAMKREIESMKLQLDAERDSLKLDLENERQQIALEREKLKVIEEEREELLQIQKQLKREIDEFRARKQQVVNEFDELRTEKQRFEKEWELLDDKREELRKETERYHEESRRMTDWLSTEEERLKLAKEELHSEFVVNTTDLSRERDVFVKQMEKERMQLFAKVESDKEELQRSIDLQRAELERINDTEREQLNRLAEERGRRLMKDVEREKAKLTEASKVLVRDSELLNLERSKLEGERQEILRQRENAEREWSAIKMDIDELQIQRERLKEQREALHRERAQVMREKEAINQKAEFLRRRKHGVEDLDSDLQYSEKESDRNVRDTGPEAEVVSSAQKDQSSLRSRGPDATPRMQEPLTIGNSSAKKLAVSPSAGLNWLKACLFKGTDNRGAGSSVSAGEEQLDRLELPNDSDQIRTPQHALQSSRSFNESQIAQVFGLEEMGRTGKRSAKRVKRTDSVLAALREARNYVEHRRQQVGANDRDEDLEERDPEGYSEVAGGQYDAGILQRPEPVPKDKEVSNEGSAQASEERRGRGGKKRRRQSAKDLEQRYVEDDESDSDIGGVGKKKKRFKDIDVLSGPNGEFNLETPGSAPDTPGGRRYNLRRSTLNNTKATQAGSSTSAEDREVSGHQEKLRTPPSIPEASVEFADVSSPPAEVADGTRHLTVTTVHIEKTVVETKVTKDKDAPNVDRGRENGETSGAKLDGAERMETDLIPSDHSDKVEDLEGEDHTMDLSDTKEVVDELVYGYEYGLGSGDGPNDLGGNGDAEEKDAQDELERSFEDVQGLRDEESDGEEDNSDGEEQEGHRKDESKQVELGGTDLELAGDDEGEDDNEPSSDSNGGGDETMPTIRQKVWDFLIT